MTDLSILDLVFVNEGSTAGEALQNSLRLARRAEELGYKRIWVAEHHNSIGIASAATAVVVGFLAQGTKTIRVGAGGVMLPNHAPLVIAEQFGTLESLYPGRIDLGVGRASGTDRLTMQALRHAPAAVQSFPQDVQELQFFFDSVTEGQKVQASPGAGLHVPLWILGSSTFGAQLAAALGLPYAFASHFAPDALSEALTIYRERFQPSEQLERPYAMVGVNVIAAETDAEARRLFTSLQQVFASMNRGQRGKFPPPIDDIETFWTPTEKMMASRMLAESIVGSPDEIRRGLTEILDRTHADELIVATAIHDVEARLRSFEILAEIQISRT
jgi:luciferase family oxidoreductase group 1